MRRLLLVGLGNPGQRFSGTRHNAGIDTLRFWVDQHGASWRVVAGIPAEVAHVSEAVDCLFPLTFMNSSGDAVASYMKAQYIAESDVFIIHDDIEVPLGTVRLKVGGSAGGHKGVRSVHEALQTQDIHRLRLGVGRPPAGAEADVFVVSRFTDEEKLAVAQMIQEAGKSVTRWVTARLGLE